MITNDSLANVLAAWSRGDIDGVGVGLSLVRHDVWVAGSAMFSGPAAAALGNIDTAATTRVPAREVIGASQDRALVLDPAGPHRFELDATTVWQLRQDLVRTSSAVTGAPADVDHEEKR
jgi:hypothetical protein